MITMEQLDNAIEIAREEIMNLENPTKSDIRDFKNRLVPLLVKLEEEADEEEDEDEEFDEEEDGSDTDET